MSDAYERVTWRGVTLNKRTAAAMEAAQKLMGRPFGSIPQGSYNTSTSVSAGTHDGGGAVDVFDDDLDKVQVVTRKTGGAGWKRETLPGVWTRHCHIIWIGDKQMSDAAEQQVRDYYRFLDGLAGSAPDHSWHPDPIPVFQYHPDLPWDGGTVYVGKLRQGTDSSDSVRRLQYVLAKTALLGGTDDLDITGNYGKATVDAVSRWQRKVADFGTNNGQRVEAFQAQRLFRTGYDVVSN